MHATQGDGAVRCTWISGQRDRGWWLPTRLSALGDNGGEDPAAHVEARREAQVPRLDRGVQVIGDLVRHGFVKGAAVAERPDVELERFELDAAPVRYVLEIERREVRLSGARAQAGDLREMHADGVVALAL